MRSYFNAHLNHAPKGADLLAGHDPVSEEANAVLHDLMSPGAIPIPIPMNSQRTPTSPVDFPSMSAHHSHASHHHTADYKGHLTFQRQPFPPPSPQKASRALALALEPLDSSVVVVSASNPVDIMAAPTAAAAASATTSPPDAAVAPATSPTSSSSSAPDTPPSGEDNRPGILFASPFIHVDEPTSPVDGDGDEDEEPIMMRDRRSVGETAAVVLEKQPQSSIPAPSN
ncbi:hypothetical protein HK101_000186, partial [Irineochytrium annulatum]